MERCLVRFRYGLTIGVACLVLTGCEPIRSLGLRRGQQDTQPERPALYDEYLSPEETSDSPKAIFKPNRLPGGLSKEAREIERESFNVY